MPVITLGTSSGIAYDASAEIAFDMQPETQYQLLCSSAAWLLIAPAGGTATKQGAANHPIPAGVPVLVGAIAKAVRCIIVKDTNAGWAHLSEVARIP